MKQATKLSAVLVLALGIGQSLLLARQNKPYRGAEYRTKASYTYGRFEVRMKSAAGSGMLTSFFTYHDPFPFSLSNWNEIDIEIMGRYQNEIQFNTITPNRIEHVHRYVLPFNPHQAFHVYGFEWTPEYVAWHVDGYEVFRQTGMHIATLSRPQKIMMNIWQPTIVDWAGTFDPAILPLYGYYDWIKYYAYTPGVNDNFTLQWTENLYAWDQSRWDKATHTFENNNVSFIHDNAVFKDGYLILCLTTPQDTGYRGGPIIDTDVDSPYLVWALAFADRMHVFLSEALDPTEAENTSNYIIPGVTVRQARLLPDERSVELQTDSLQAGKSYLLVVRNLQDRAVPAHTMGVQQTTAVQAVRLPAKIDVGGSGGAGYLPDAIWDYYRPYGHTGGEGLTIPADITITESDGDAAYRTQIRNLAFYHVRLLPGTYDLTLQFADAESEAPGERVFDVLVEGQRVLDDLDIYAEVGKNAALVRHLNNVVVDDGVLDLYFASEVGSPVLSGLHIAPHITTGAEEKKGEAPASFDLRAFPNPFNPETRLKIGLPQAGRVELILYDLIGRNIWRHHVGFLTAGAHTLLLDVAGLSAGVYFLQLAVNGIVRKTLKMTVLR